MFGSRNNRTTPKPQKPSPTALYKPGVSKARPNLAKERLIQQMGILDTQMTHLKAELAAMLDKCRIMVEACDHAIADIGPVLEQWIANGFTPDTPKMRRLAAKYVAIVKRRHEARMAEALLLQAANEAVNESE